MSSGNQINLNFEILACLTVGQNYKTIIQQYFNQIRDRIYSERIVKCSNFQDVRTAAVLTVMPVSKKIKTAKPASA